MGPNARESNRKTGERMVADEVRWIGAKVDALMQAYDREQPEHRLRTFEDVEVLWESVVRPALRDFHTMQDLWKGQSPPSPNSVWYANWRVPDRG